MQIWHLHEVQDRCSARGPEGQRELRPPFASPGVCMCLTAMSSCGVNKFWIMYHGWERSPTLKPGLLEPSMVGAKRAYAGPILFVVGRRDVAGICAQRAHQSWFKQA